MSDNTNAPLLPGSQNTAQVAWQQAHQRFIDNKSIVYQSEAMSQLMKMVERVAPSNANVLILGESGTGKELVANIIHEKNARKNKPFVAVNCGALRETLLESELFGHEKGSFTGAFQRKIGLAEVADGGTIFLDEIGELAPSIQSKFLRFLQEGEIYRVGGKDPIKVDVRVICATNRDLEKEVEKGNFREDLYYRINTIVLTVPPLRRRKEDVELLVRHFLASHDSVLHKAKQVDSEAMQALIRYDWPGNIRELQNVVERLQILTEGHTIMLNDLPENIRNPEQREDIVDYYPEVTLGDLEKRYIIKALSHFRGNKTQAAQALGITIKTLYNKLHEYGEFDRFAVHSKLKM